MHTLAPHSLTLGWEQGKGESAFQVEFRSRNSPLMIRSLNNISYDTDAICILILHIGIRTQGRISKVLDFVPRDTCLHDLSLSV